MSETRAPLPVLDDFDFPWMPLYVDDLLALAATLDAEQLGGLLRLKCFAWRQTPRCSLPDSDPRLATISGLGTAWGDKGDALRELLTPMEGGRLLDTALLGRFIEQVERYQLSLKRKAAGAAGGRRSAAVRGNQPPTKPGSNGRSSPPTKTADLLRGALGSVVGTGSRTENTEDVEATAEANPPGRRVLDLSDPAFDSLRPAPRRPSSALPTAEADAPPPTGEPHAQTSSPDSPHADVPPSPDRAGE